MKQRKKLKSRKAKPLRAVPGSGIPELRTDALYRSPRMIMPATYRTKMRYIVDYLFGAPAANLDSLRFTSNAYDVDPTLASTAMAGFAELGAIYQRFRTMGIGYRFNLANKEAFPLSVIHGLSTVSIGSGSLGMNYGENPLFSTSILGPTTGQGVKSVSRKITPITHIVGTHQPLFDDTFTGSTSSSTLPTIGTVYAYIGISANGVVGGFVNSCICHVEINLDVEFYRPAFLVS